MTGNKNLFLNKQLCIDIDLNMIYTLKTLNCNIGMLCLKI
jgi:hypothetical protein